MSGGGLQEDEAWRSASPQDGRCELQALHQGCTAGRPVSSASTMMPSRTPTPSQFGGRSRTSTPWSQSSSFGCAAYAALEEHCGSSSAGLGLALRPGTSGGGAPQRPSSQGADAPPRAGTALGNFAGSAALSAPSGRGGTEGSDLPPLGASAPLRPASTRSRNDDLHDFFGKVPVSHAQADDLRPTRSRPAPPYAPLESQAATNWARGGGLHRPPGGRVGLAPLAADLGGLARAAYRPTSEPARMASPEARPHNAWCTFVEWVPPANGSEDSSLSYELQCRDELSDNVLLLTDIGPKPLAQFNGLEAGRTYFFQVRALNEQGTGPWSQWSRGYLVPEPAEIYKRRSFLQAQSGSLRPRLPVTHSDHPHMAVLEWSEPCGHGAQIIGYKVQYGLDPEDPDTLTTQTILQRRTSVVITDLLPSHIYFYRVQAISEVGESEWTEWSDGLATRALGPQPPEPPVLTAARPRSLVVAWRAPFACGFKVTRYDIRVSADRNMQKAVVQLRGEEGLSEACSMKVEGLEPWTEYFFQVRAESAMGLSEWSETSLPLRTTAARPGACHNLQVIQNVYKTVSLEFTSPESNGLPISAFVVRWSENAMFEPEMGRIEVPGTERSTKVGAKILCKITGIKPGSIVFFDCAAKNEVGIGPFCPPTEETVAAYGPPTTPSPPTVAERTAASLLVVFRDFGDAKCAGAPHTYELMYDHTSDMTSAKILGVMREAAGSTDCARVFQYPLTSLEAWGPYFFSVRAHNDVGSSAWSPPSAAYVLSCDAPAKMASPLLVEARSSSCLVVSYMPPANLGTSIGGAIIEYELRYCRDAGVLLATADSEDCGTSTAVALKHSGAAGSASEVAKILLKRIRTPGHTLQAQPVEVSELITGKTYVFQIRAVSAFGCGKWSDLSAPFETLSSPPSKPVPLVAVPGHDNPYSLAVRMTLPECNGKPVTFCRIRLLGPTWKNMDPAKEWKDWGVPGTSEIEPDDCDVRCTESNGIEYIAWQYSLLPLKPGAEYRFVWSARNAMDWSEWSDESEPIKTQPSVPEQCTSPYLMYEDEDRSDKMMKLNWDAPFDNGSEITRYTLLWSSSSRFCSYATVDDILEPTYTLRDLQPNTWYYVKVYAWNAVGPGQPSNLETSKAAGASCGCLQTRAREPGFVQNIKVRPVDNVPGAVYLTWMKPLDDGGSIVTRYKIAVSLTSDFEAYTEVVQKASRECKLTDIKPDTVYYFDVAAANSVGYGELSGSPVMCRTLPIPPQKFIPPQRPRKPLVQVSQNGDPVTAWQKAEIQVSWSCPEKYCQRRGFLYNQDTQTHMVLHYAVQLRGGVPDPAQAEDIKENEHFMQVRDKRGVPKETSNVIVFDSLMPGRFYQAFVQAFSAAGSSGWSVASDIVRAPPGAPDAVKEIALEEFTATSLKVTWVCPWGNGEEVVSFCLRVRTDRLLRGFREGMPAAPEDANDDDGVYDDTTCSWSPVVQYLVKDCLVKAWEPQGDAAITDTAAGQLCTWTVDGLQPASFYSFEVIAKNVVGNSEACSSLSLRSVGVRPAPCSAMHGHPDQATTTSVTFSWQPPKYQGGEPIEEYQVVFRSFRFDDQIDFGTISKEDFLASFDEESIVHVPASQTNFTAQGLLPGDTVLPLVRCRNCKGFSEWNRFPVQSAVPSLTAKSDLPGILEVAPELRRDKSQDHKPYALSAYWTCPAQNGTWIRYFKLQLIPSTDDHGAVVHEFTVHAAPGQRWKRGDTVSAFFVHESLVPGIEYVLRVRATSEAGDAREWSAPSRPDMAPPDRPAQPDAPTSIWQWPYAIQLEWVEPWLKGAALDRCEVLYSLTSAFDDPVLAPDAAANKDLAKKEIVVEGFAAATTVWFRLRVRNAVDWSEWSRTSAGFTTSACKPAPPERPCLVGMNAESLQIAWEEPDAHGAPIIDYTILLVDFERTLGFEKALRDFDDGLQKAINEAIDENGDGDVSLEELKLAMQRKEIQDMVQRLCDDADDAFDERLKPRARLVLRAEDLGSATLMHTFTGLLGGIQLAVAMRARNDKGFSDWSVPLDGLRTPASVPEQCPPLMLVEATPSSFRCKYRLPYSGGDSITSMDFQWFHVLGPMERHLALGGDCEKAHPDYEPMREGTGSWDLPRPWPEPAPPGGMGGSAEGLLSGLQPGTEYDVQVRAVNAIGAGLWSNKVRMISLAGRPDRPTCLRHVNKTSAALPPTDQMSAGGPGLRGASPVAILPTVFFSHTGRLRGPEAVSVAAGSRLVQSPVPDVSPRPAGEPQLLEEARNSSPPRWR